MAQHFELSIDVRYLPEWGIWEGVRELIQNGQDAVVEHHAPLTVDFKNGTLRIENEGVTLPREALLFGNTSKGGRADLIGKFGEGLKLGVLALVRAGCKVKIRSGSEVWRPSIKRSDRYAADVLSFEIHSGRADDKRVRIEIGGVSEEAWQEYRLRFLFLKDGRLSDKAIVKTLDGDLLLHERYAGRLYCKGIFVQNVPRLRWGYNFKSDVELDRDRKMIGTYDRDWMTFNILNAAMVRRPDLIDEFCDLLDETDCEDVAGLTEYRTPTAEVVSTAAARFRERFGDKATPCLTTADALDIEHFGKRGIVVSKALYNVLKHEIDTPEKVRENLKTEIVKRYSSHELTVNERYVLFEALKLAAKACGGESPRTNVTVVDFRSVDLEGLYKGGDVCIARKILRDRALTLKVLIHEYAHDFGGDGDKGHVSTIEEYWSRLAEYLRGP